MDKPEPTQEQIRAIIDLALAEDIGDGDITSRLLIDNDITGKAIILAKEEGTLAGGEVARLVFARVEPALKAELLIEDGQKVKPGNIVITISGNLNAILAAERTALNFLSRMSGVASLTAEYAARTEGTRSVIFDTRKTMPGMRLLDKYAVRCGGGRNHRRNLGDAVLIKDNHLAALRAQGLSLADIVARAKKDAPEEITIEVEVNTPDEALEAAEAGADIVLLDNMTPDEMRQAVARLPEGVRSEASGGVNLENVGRIAKTGVDIISIGALTHSAKALDFSLELDI
jgi:nicotinate-nucleotide pyrophosphorylase (carboxylating)